MKHRILALCCGLLMSLIVPATALAADEEAAPQARFEGFGTKSVKLEPSSTAPSWFILALLAGVCVAVLFKDAKRSHMD